MILSFAHALICSLFLAAGDAHPAAPTPTADLPPFLTDLASPWRAERAAAARRLRHLPATTALGVVETLLGAAEPRLRAAAVDWLGERLRRSPDFEDLDRVRDLIVQAALSARDPLVRDRVVRAAAADGEVVARLREAAGRGRYPAEDLSRLLDGRVADRLVHTLHEGHIPGFFDGQFADTLAVDASAVLRLVRFAWDPRVAYVLRAMAVMALHESGDPRLSSFLSPLLVSPGFEYDWPNDLLRIERVGETEVRTYVACRLSQYARFSMAKAGIDAPIRRKIDFLEARARSELERAESAERGEPYRAYMLEQAMETLFEIGYHHQQLDEYEEAAARYRSIIQRPEALRVRKWAHYNLACILALQGRRDEALAQLRGALESGFTDFSWARRDGDLASLHEDPRFHRLLDRFERGQNPDSDDSDSE